MNCKIQFSDEYEIYRITASRLEPDEKVLDKFIGVIKNTISFLETGNNGFIEFEILKPFFDKCKSVLPSNLHPLYGKIISEDIQFNTSWRFSSPDVDIPTALKYLEDNFLNDLKKESSNKPKLSVRQIALIHAYWSQIDPTKAITKTNSKTFKDLYGKSNNTILTAYETFKSSDNRIPPSINDKRSVIPFIKDMEIALQHLRNVCPDAAKLVRIDLDELKKRFSDFYKIS